MERILATYLIETPIAVEKTATFFGPWMNFSGSILANYWRKRPVDKTDLAESEISESVETPARR